MRSNHVCAINRSGSAKSENQASILESRRTAPVNRSRSFIRPGCQLARSLSSNPTRRPSSISLCQELLEVRKELLPPVRGALVVLLLIRPETRLLHAQESPCARRGESPSHYTPEILAIPRVGQRLVRLDGLDLTVDGTPICA